MITRAILLKGACNDGIYTFPTSMVPVSSKKVTNVHIRTSLDGWHKHLGHPSTKIVHSLVKSFSLPITSNQKLLSLCHSYSINKAHQQPFHVISLKSHAPLDIIYTDVWGLASYTGLDGFRYYLIFMDHYTKYTWFYPMVTKSGVSTIFPLLKKVVENRFQKTIKTLYSDNGGEFIALKSYLSLHGISHYTTAPHTHQQNGVSERRHRHLVETGLTLLHDANLDFSYWPYAFQTASYLINRQPTPLLHGKSPLEVLFGQPPNYLKFKKFGCICYPFTRPYNSNKMQPKSQTCIFLGYSLTQNEYKCFEPTTKKFFTSRHVLFDEHKYFFRPSIPVSSSSSHTTSESQTWLPLPLVPSMSVLSPSNLTCQHQEGPLAIVTSSSGNLDNSSDHSTLPCFQNPTLHPPSSPDLLPAAMPNSSPSPSATNSSFPPILPHSPHPILPATPEPSYRIHSMTTRSMNQIFKPEQLNTISKYPFPQTIEPTSVS